MVKKILVTATIASIVISLITTVSLAAGSGSHGITQGYDGSGAYEQAWVDFTAYPNVGYQVTVYVNRSGTHLGYNTTTVSAGNSARCYSLKVPGYGGTEGWYAVPI